MPLCAQLLREHGAKRKRVNQETTNRQIAGFIVILIEMIRGALGLILAHRVISIVKKRKKEKKGRKRRLRGEAEVTVLAKI